MAIFNRAVLLLCLLSNLAACLTPRVDHVTKISLPDLVGDADATVLYWWASQCPCVSRYQSRIHDLRERYSPLGVHFYAISSNSDDRNEEHTKATATSRGNQLPIIMDEQGALAASLDVKSTPTVILLDRQGAVRFKGWIDNERQIGASDRIPYLEDALRQVLADQKVAAPDSPAYGCRITRRLQ